ncbi:MAG: hypothetical protein M0R73_05395 [Dehalococcoidia bacterium]|nr:hypothetical protein [Dehalococcoidia bacterium]
MSDHHDSHDGGPADGDASSLAREWREVRVFALEVAATIPETRIYRGTERAGWTLKHELSHLAALDAEVLHLLRLPTPGAGRPDAVAVRRLRGQAMHRAQDMRLAALRAHLGEMGEETACAIEAAGDVLSQALGATGDAGTLGEHVRQRLAAARAGLEGVREVIGK